MVWSVSAALRKLITSSEISLIISGSCSLYLPRSLSVRYFSVSCHSWSPEEEVTSLMAEPLQDLGVSNCLLGTPWCIRYGPRSETQVLEHMSISPTEHSPLRNPLYNAGTAFFDVLRHHVDFAPGDSAPSPRSTFLRVRTQSHTVQVLCPLSDWTSLATKACTRGKTEKALIFGCRVLHQTFLVSSLLMPPTMALLWTLCVWLNLDNTV